MTTTDIRELSAEEIGAVSGGVVPFVAGMAVGSVLMLLVAKVTQETVKPGTAVKDAANIINGKIPK